MKFKLFYFVLLLALGLHSCQSYDLIIQNGTIYNGENTEPFQGDIGIHGEKITKIGNLKRAKSDHIIDASGLVVSPGFIDLHSHLVNLEGLPHGENFLRQGVTTAIEGQDGGSPYPLSKKLNTLDSIGLGLNVGYFAGLGALRWRVIGSEDQVATSDDIAAMQDSLVKAMKEGAFGISTGLNYVPGKYATTEELVALVKAVSHLGGYYSTHMRSEGSELIEGMEEALLIGESADIPVHISHHKAMGIHMWGASKETLRMIDEANANGMDVTLDQYPYNASQTELFVCIPAWALSGGRKAFTERLENHELRDSIKRSVVHELKTNRCNDLKRIQFAKIDWKPELTGKTLYDWVIMEGMEPTFENGAELVMKGYQSGPVQCIYHVMHEDDVLAIMQHPKTMVASDGTLTPFGWANPHPRSYGAFPRVLGEYVREKKVLSLSEAISKMTGNCALRLGLIDRGFLREGYYADIVIFDPDTIQDMGTFIKPHQYPKGIHYVLVNGQTAVEGDILHPERNGKILYGPAYEFH